MTHRACRVPRCVGMGWPMNRANLAVSLWPYESRAATDRRRRVWWSVCYGSFNPRRRTPPRRLDDSRFHSLDWHSAHLLAVAIGILLLCVVDALMTLTLLQGGAAEINPIMALLLGRSVAAFAALKLAMTGAGTVS